MMTFATKELEAAYHKRVNGVRMVLFGKINKAWNHYRAGTTYRWFDCREAHDFIADYLMQKSLAVMAKTYRGPR